MIRIEKLRKEFGAVVALDDLSLEVGKGEFCAFLGPNAAGKTTTIRIMTGLLEATSGRVTIGGHDVRGESAEAKRLIGYVPDVPYLYGKLTVGEFAEFVMAIYGLQLDGVRQGVLDRFGLGPYMSSLTEDCSHGIRQRLVLATALMHDPEVIILDEPFVSLDPKTAVIVKETLTQRIREGATIFMSTHTLALAEELADRIAIIDGGRLIAVGTPSELSVASGSDGGLEDTFMKLTEERTTVESVRCEVEEERNHGDH